mmetsp:Transcript_134090/g.388123  ORF Transcript_134090/g.388123 Transcript_134090/m.388123 type:complete len:227 (+) Transcript_134090:1713-2393(+)
MAFRGQHGGVHVRHGTEAQLLARQRRILRRLELPGSYLDDGCRVVLRHRLGAEHSESRRRLAHRRGQGEPEPCRHAARAERQRPGAGREREDQGLQGIYASDVRGGGWPCEGARALTSGGGGSERDERAAGYLLAHRRTREPTECVQVPPQAGDGERAHRQQIGPLPVGRPPDAWIRDASGVADLRVVPSDEVEPPERRDHQELTLPRLQRQRPADQWREIARIVP